MAFPPKPTHFFSRLHGLILFAYFSQRKNDLNIGVGLIILWKSQYLMYQLWNAELVKISPVYINIDDSCIMNRKALAFCDYVKSMTYLSTSDV